MTQFRYFPALDSIESALSDRLHLKQMSLAGRASAYTGSWKGRDVRLSFRFWCGPKVAVARTVRLEGSELEIANLVAVAARPYDAPILGIDLVAARPDAGLVVADLSPLSGAGCEIAGLPDWARIIFSADPIFARVTPETAPDALARIAGMAGRFAGLVADAPALESTALRDAAVERYRDCHLQDERMRSMLANMFGPDTATTLMNDVLFPPELIDHVCA